MDREKVKDPMYVNPGEVKIARAKVPAVSW